MKRALAVAVVVALYAIVGYVIMGRQCSYPSPPKPAGEQWQKIKAKQKDIGGYTIITDENGKMYYYNRRGVRCRIIL